MKRLVAKRKLKRKCIMCDKEFNKGEVYYKHREVYADYEGKVSAYEYLECPKCKCKEEEKAERFKKFKDKCKHPEEFRCTSYRYIPGECVQEPDYEYCWLCGKIL